MTTPYHDDDGIRIKERDWVMFTYGIPPVYVRGEVVRRDNRLIVLTPGHNPTHCRLSELRDFVGSFYKWTKPVTLPNDVARCDGYYAEGWRVGCETCLRRTAPRPGNVWMIAPPAIVVFECEYLIELKP